MLVLDENLPESQCQRLRNWRMRFRIIGVEIAAWGTRDENLIPVLHRLPNPTFFSLDRDFYRPAWKHASYCLVWLNIPDNHAADFIRRFLRHPAFGTQAKRMGIVARVHAEGVQLWKIDKRTSESVRWDSK